MDRISVFDLYMIACVYTLIIQVFCITMVVSVAQALSLQRERLPQRIQLLFIGVKGDSIAELFGLISYYYDSQYFGCINSMRICNK